MTQSTVSEKPTPGNKEAIALGCLCPVADNSKGAGYLGTGTFWINGDCELHTAHLFREVLEPELQILPTPLKLEKEL
jgi:hypothetical protein